MRKKNWAAIFCIFVVIAAFIAAAGIGLVKKQEYTNYLAEDDYMPSFSVSLLSEEIAESLTKNIADDMPFILQVRSIGYTHDFFYRKDYVVVEKVYQGEGITPGETISLLAYGGGVDCKTMEVEMRFSNLMQKDKSYLVFLERKLEPLKEEEYPLYVYPDTILMPKFCLEDMESVIPPKEVVVIPGDESMKQVSWSEVSKNEFFAESEEALKKLQAIKKEILQTYQ